MPSQTPGAIQMRRWRASLSPEQRAAYLARRVEYNRRARLDPKKKEKERLRASRAYRKAISNPQRKAAISQSARERYWLNQPWRIAQEARGRAEKRGLPYNLTREWAFSSFTGVCAVTGIPFALRSTTITAFSPTIDRVDNARGYTQDNCRWVLYGVNALKNNGTDADMVRIARAIVGRGAC